MTDEQKRIVIPVLTAVVLLAAFFYLARSSMMTLSGSKRELSELRRKEKAITQLGELEAKEKTLLQTFRRANEKDDVIKEVADWARSEGIEINEIEPSETSIPRTNFVKLMFTMKGSGSYLPIMRFLKNLEAAPYFVLASSLELEGYEPRRGRFSSERSETGSDSNMFKVTINAFLVES